MSTTVGNSESTGVRNARSTDGMTSASNGTGSFTPRCLSLDLEVGVGVRCTYALSHRYDDKFSAGLAHVERCPLPRYDSQPSLQR